MTFRRLNLPASSKKIFKVYYVIEKNRSKVMDAFKNIPQDTRDEIKDLIIKMATIKDFKSDKIRWRLVNYSYGELKPKGHRFFFFLKYGNSIVFFKYAIKKKNSLRARFYKMMELEKLKYEQEFEKSLQRNR